MGNCFKSPPTPPTDSKTLQDIQNLESRTAHQEQLNQVAEKWKDDSKKIWSRPISELPVHLDLPRLGRKIRIIENGRPVFDKMTTKIIEENHREIVFQFLKILADILQHISGQENEQNELLEIIEEKYYHHIKTEGDMSQQLLSFFKEEIPEQDHLIKLLKLCHQKMVFPGYYYLKSFLFEKETFKDKRGSWNVIITFLESERRIHIQHFKVQQSKVLVNEKRPEFEFTWRLTFTMDFNFDEIIELDVKILSLFIHPAITEKRKKEIRDAFERPEILKLRDLNESQIREMNQEEDEDGKEQKGEQEE